MILEYHRPDTLAEALDLLARKSPVTVPLGGGTVLSQQSKPDFAVVDLQNLGLDAITQDAHQLTIGAAAPLQALLEYADLPDGIGAALRQCLEIEASANLRRTATVAGTLVSCDGRSPLATALLALDARLVWAPQDEVQMLSDFLPLRKPFGHERLMLSIRVALNARLAFESVARTPLDRPIVCAAAAAWPAGRMRLALGGHGPTPILAMDGMEPGEAVVVAAREAYRFSVDAWGSAEYRMDIAGKLARRLVAQLGKS